MIATSVVIPAYNEEGTIAETVRAAGSIPGVMEVIVVDDGSRDTTADRAAGAGAKVLREPRNRGKGAALRRGASAAAGELLLLLDADLGASAKEGARLAEAISSGAADLAVATLPRGPHKGGFGLARRLAARGIERLTGRAVREPMSGQRALRKVDLERIGGIWDGWQAEVAMTVMALRAGLRLVEVPCDMRHNLTGRDVRAVVHRLRQYLAVRRALARLERRA